MLRATKIVVLAVCAVTCASQPVEQSVEKFPILKTLPSSEIGIRTPDKEITIECVTVDKDKNVKYSWLKDGKPYTPHANVVQLENEGTLVFKKPDRSDEGQYQCLAQTEYGVASTRVVTLKKLFMDPPNYTLKKHKPVEGKPYKLDCTIPKSYPQPDLVWFKKSLTDPNDSKIVSDQRLTISDQGDLYFSNVTKEDAQPGYKYVCYGKAPDSGENLDPLAHPDWFKDGKDVNNGPGDRVTRHNRSKGKRLVIKDVWLSDEGEYTCVVDNEVGKPQNHTMHLHVVSAPQFIEVGPATLTVQAGSEFSLPCAAAGAPAPALSWTLNTRSLPGGPQPVSRGNSSAATLTVRQARRSAAGYYGCRATSAHGDVYSETLVYVH